MLRKTKRDVTAPIPAAKKVFAANALIITGAAVNCPHVFFLTMWKKHTTEPLRNL